VQYPGEIHFVYMNPLTKQIAVLGIFMQSLFLDVEAENDTMQAIDIETRQEWQRFFEQAQYLRSENLSVTINLNLDYLMSENLRDFWRYEGSLTTPPCTEGIIWTIFKQPINFVESEFKSFRQNIFFEDYRRPQPLYQRTIHRNFFNETLSAIPDYNCCQRKEVMESNSATRMGHFLLVIAFSLYMTHRL
jgi:carbonic anhydrase